MPIPVFNVHGVLPPYVGLLGPGGAHADMSPYVAPCLEVVQALGTTPYRLAILDGWLRHRAELRQIGMSQGFQWLDGSFVEDKIPNDLDLVTFFHSPPVLLSGTQATASAFLQVNAHLFERQPVKQSFMLDAFWVNLSGRAEDTVLLTRYYFGLFSHRRLDDMWKGMVEVGLADATEAAAVQWVTAGVASSTAAQAGGGP